MLRNYLLQLTVAAILQERGHRLDQGVSLLRDSPCFPPSPRKCSSFGLAPANPKNSVPSIDYRTH